jgi:glutamate--cysteine ligase
MVAAVTAATTEDPGQQLAGYDAVRGYVERVCFKTGPPGLVGTELEWLVASPSDPFAPVPIARLRDLLEAAGPLPAGSRLTYEPGGQLELSSLAYRGPTACWRSLSMDTDHVRAVLRQDGLDLLPTALDPYRPPRRQLTLPRYEAMAAYFEAIGSETGTVMMNSTAATQVNLDVGDDRAEACRRWRLLHAVGPVMVAAFANSPRHAGADTGWKCGRQRVWQGLDPARTAAPQGTDPVQAWTDYVLDARVMLPPERAPEVVRAPFRSWLDGETDPPATGDLELHLTTLFPPVRPRGWFEVRYVDAQPLDWWPVPMAVLSALVDDPAAGRAAESACAPLDDWVAAARDGYAVAGLQAAAETSFAAAVHALERSAEHPDLAALVAAFTDRYVSRGRCPADDPIPEAS